MDWLSKDKSLIWHPYTQQKTAPPPIFIESARGAWLYDDSGRAILDAISSWWVTLHGHAHPYIAEKLGAQARKLEQVIFAGFTHRPAIELAEKLVPLLPGPFSRIFYSDNGSTATEVAVKMAIQYWWNQSPSTERRKILVLQDAYHGDTFGAMAVSGRSVFTEAFADYLFDVVSIPRPAAENIEALQLQLEQEAHQYAAFIYEPLLQGAGGMQVYEAQWLNQLLVQLHRHGVICIADEVLTGFGRTGRLFASENMEEKPDIICLSKGLTGGTLALGVTACTETIFNAYCNDDRRKTLFHGHSFTANPLACTAAIASLELFEKEGTLERVANIGRWHAEALEHFQAELGRAGKIGGLRQQGTILAFEIDQARNQYLSAIGPEITQRALAQNIYLRPLGNTLYFLPPYCLTREEHAQLTESTVNICRKL